MGVDVFVGSPTIPGGLPQLEAVTFAGDSFTAGGTNGDSTTVRFSSQTCSKLTTALGRTITENNIGIGGARQSLFTNSGVGPDILVQVYQEIAPPASATYAPTVQVGVVQCSINNLTEQAYVDDMSIAVGAVQRAIERYRSSGVYEALNTARWPSASFANGTWEVISPETDANSGNGFMRAESNGCTWTCNLPSDFPGGVIRLYGIKAAGFGAVETIKVDGVSAGTSDNTDATLTQGSQSWVFETTSLASGSHAITGTISSLSSVEHINGIDFETAAVPLVIVINTAHAPNYPGGVHTITDQNVTDQNTALASMISSVYGSDPNVVLFDMDTTLGNHVGNFGADGVHPNSTGAGLIADGLVSVIEGFFS